MVPEETLLSFHTKFSLFNLGKFTKRISLVYGGIGLQIEQFGCEAWLGSRCSWARHIDLTVPPATQLYKWVLASLMLAGNPTKD